MNKRIVPVVVVLFVSYMTGNLRYAPLGLVVLIVIAFLWGLVKRKQ